MYLILHSIERPLGSRARHSRLTIPSAPRPLPCPPTPRLCNSLSARVLADDDLIGLHNFEEEPAESINTW